MVRVQQEWVSPGGGADGGHKGDTESVHVGSKDDCTLGGDGGLAHDGSKSTPLLHIEGNIGIRDQAMSFGVCSADDHDPSEHSMTSVPLLGKDGGTPSILSKGTEFLFPGFLSIFVSLRANDVRGSNARGDVQGAEISIRIFRWRQRVRLRWKTMLLQKRLQRRHIVGFIRSYHPKAWPVAAP